MADLPLLEKTVQFWQPRASRGLTHEDARQMLENVTGFFTTLQRWSEVPSGMRG
jgi:hypothetical protein